MSTCSAGSTSIAAQRVPQSVEHNPALVDSCIVHSVDELIAQTRLLQITEELCIYHKFLAQLGLLQPVQHAETNWTIRCIDHLT